MILDFKKGIGNKNWTKNVYNEKVSWNKIKEIEARLLQKMKECYILNTA